MTHTATAGELGVDAGDTELSVTRHVLSALVGRPVLPHLDHFHFFLKLSPRASTS